MRREYNPALEPDKPFYRFAKDQLTGKSGDLLKHEVLEQGLDAALSAARATYRVLYQSSSGLGDDDAKPTDEPIAVSGLVAFPRGEMPAGGWPVVSWAHGTVGSNDDAAPSMDPYVDADFGERGKGLLRNINRAPHDLLNAFLKAGWAVAMTDYEGLGTYGNHPYLLGVSEGRGILDIVPAARQLAEALELELSERYAIVGHSQGGQAALWAAHLASTGQYGSPGHLIGVAALAPASNLHEQPPAMALPAAYVMGDVRLVGDLGGFFVLFCNGVFGGDASIDPAEIFQVAAKERYEHDYNRLSRAELSLEEFWTERPPLAPATLPDLTDRSAGIFRTQRDQINGPLKPAWVKYWKQVENFNPARLITVPIRISQAGGDERVKPEKTTQLVGQLEAIEGIGRITMQPYAKGEVSTPVPRDLGEHFGLLVHEPEIDAIIGWFAELQTSQR